MNATQTLRDEHRVILRVLDGFDNALHAAARSRQVAPPVFEPFLEFFRGFADRCHHGKEEDRLFPCLQRCGMPGDCGPIAVMLEEHRQGRFHVRSMAECLTAASGGHAQAVEAFLQHGFAFLELLRNHIGKEDHVLFHMADQMVQGAALSSLLKDYEQVEQDAEYAERYARCRRIAEQVSPPSEETGAHRNR